MTPIIKITILVAIYLGEIMINSNEYNLVKFGNIMFNLRKRSKLTKAAIRSVVGLNPDTIRKLEYGYSMPTLETLSKLSEVYNVNMEKILEGCKYQNDEIIDSLKEKLDYASYNDDLDILEDILEEIQTIKSPSSSVNSYIEQLKYLIMIAKIKNKTDVMNVMNSEQYCYSALKITKSDLSISNLSQHNFTPLECRFLLNLAIAKSRLNKIDDSLSITEIALENLEIHYNYRSNCVVLLIRAFYSMAHFHYLRDEHYEVIDYCNKAIKLSHKEHNVRILPFILFRKGVAELLSDNEEYHKTLKNHYYY